MQATPGQRSADERDDPRTQRASSRNWWMPWLDRALPDLSFEGGSREPEPEPT